MSKDLPSPASAPVPLGRLVRNALRALLAIRFSFGTLREHRFDWRSLIVFARERGFPPVFSTHLATAFLKSRRVRMDSRPRNRRKADLLLHVRRLEQFAREGRFSFQRRLKPREPLRGDFECTLENFVRFLVRQRGIRPTSLRYWRRNLRRFLLYLEAQGVHSLSQIQPAMLSDYIATKIPFSPCTVAGIASNLRGFLRYLFMQGVVSEDLSHHVPRIRMWRQDRLPTVWTASEIEAMLAAIERSSPVGKRNYAIVLLACRLGLRTCDIRALRLEDLRWDEAKITLRQSKTGAPLVLPLSEEVGEALIDYLKHGRPQSPHREVFLGAHAPFAPFGHSYNFHTILTAYRQRAGIKVPREGRCAMHSLRHTLATRLLDRGTPLPVISDILGHCSITSTQIYLKVDLPSLRTVALDPEEVFHG